MHTHMAHTKSFLYLSGVGGELRMTSPAGTLCSSIVTTDLHLTGIADNHIAARAQHRPASHMHTAIQSSIVVISKFLPMFNFIF